MAMEGCRPAPPGRTRRGRLRRGRRSRCCRRAPRQRVAWALPGRVAARVDAQCGGDRRRRPPRCARHAAGVRQRPARADRQAVVRALPLALAGVRAHPGGDRPRPAGRGRRDHGDPVGGVLPLRRRTGSQRRTPPVVRGPLGVPRRTATADDRHDGAVRRCRTRAPRAAGGSDRCGGRPEHRARRVH